VLQDAFIAFYKEWAKTKTQPAFVTDKTVAADIAKMADANKRFSVKSCLFVSSRVVSCLLII
jgi:hypothetical protein